MSSIESQEPQPELITEAMIERLCSDKKVQGKARFALLAIRQFANTLETPIPDDPETRVAFLAALAGLAVGWCENADG